jgi:hypothetical protein
MGLASTLLVVIDRPAEFSNIGSMKITAPPGGREVRSPEL